MNLSAWLGVGTLATAIVGLALIVWQLREQRRAIRAEFGNLYVQRYWEIDDALLCEPKGTARHDQHRHRYLRLFEDEYDVASLGFLDRQQWRAWHSTLDQPTNLAQVKSDLLDCTFSVGSFQKLRTCIDQRDREGRPHDVVDCDAR